MIVEGKSVEETARETNHSPEKITRYVKDYKHILSCLHKGLTPKETAFVVKVSENLVFAYVNLIQENQVDIIEQIGRNGSIFDDVPFCLSGQKTLQDIRPYFLKRQYQTHDRVLC